MNKLLSDCTLCPRNCHADRNSSAKGYCGQGGEITLARAALHMWEEPCISGESGSGTVFFTGCGVRCVFCQNHDIAVMNRGIQIDTDRLVQIFFELADKGANSINLVTPTHFVPHIIDAVLSARKKGFTLPIVYNTSGYEKAETLKMLDSVIDIYLPDFKYMNPILAKKYSNAPDYADFAKTAIAEMVRSQPNPVFNTDGIMQKGVIVRHLVLPGQVDDSKRIIEYLHREYGNSIYISIMNQYTPMPNVSAFPELMRTVTADEYSEVVDFAVDIGVENGFIQEGAAADESFIPNFGFEGVLEK